MRQRLLLLLLALLSVLVAADAATAADAVRLRIALVADQSSSMFLRTDPGGDRFRAVTVAASELCGHATGGVTQEIAVVPFGSTAPPDQVLPLTPACRAQRTFAKRLRRLPALGGTNYPAALRGGSDVLGPATPGVKRVEIVITDGRPMMAHRDDAGLDAAFGRLASVLKRQPGVEVHVVLLHSTPALADRWRALPVASVTVVRDVGRENLSRSYLRILAQAFGLATGDELTLSSAQPTGTLVLPPYQDEATISVLSTGGAAAVEVHPPGGAAPVLVRSGVAGLGERAFAAPTAGTWSAKLVGGDGALVAIARRAPALRIQSPRETAPSGSKLTISASLASARGGTLRQQSAFPIYVGAQLLAHGRAVAVAPLRGVGPGRYRATVAAPADCTAGCSLELSARGGTAVFATSTTPLRLTDQPYVTSATQVTSGTPFAVPLTLRVAGHDSAAADVLDGDPNALISATLRSGTGTVASGHATYVSGSRFVVRLDYRPHKGERLTLSLALAGRQADGTAFTDATDIALTAHESPAAVSARRNRIIAVVAGALLLLVIASYVGWMGTRRKLPFVYIAGGERVTMGGSRFGHTHSGPDGIWVWGTRRGARWRRGRFLVPFGAQDARPYDRATDGRRATHIRRAS